MRLMRIPAPTKNAERPVLGAVVAGFALGAGGAGGDEAGSASPTCSTVSPATELAVLSAGIS